MNDNPSVPLYCTISDHRMLEDAGYLSCPKCGGSTATYYGESPVFSEARLIAVFKSLPSPGKGRVP